MAADFAGRIGHDGRVQVCDGAWARQLHGQVRDHAAGPWREHHDAVGHEDRLGDAVGDQHDGRGGTLPEAQELQVEPLAGQRIERTERLVQEQDLRLERERPRERDTLAGAAGQLRRSVRGDARIQADKLGEQLQSLAASLDGPAGQFQRVRDVGGR